MGYVWVVGITLVIINTYFGVVQISIEAYRSDNSLLQPSWLLRGQAPCEGSLTTLSVPPTTTTTFHKERASIPDRNIYGFDVTQAAMERWRSRGRASLHASMVWGRYSKCRFPFSRRFSLLIFLFIWFFWNFSIFLYFFGACRCCPVVVRMLLLLLSSSSDFLPAVRWMRDDADVVDRQQEIDPENRRGPWIELRQQDRRLFQSARRTGLPVRPVQR